MTEDPVEAMVQGLENVFQRTSRDVVWFGRVEFRPDGLEAWGEKAVFVWFWSEVSDYGTT